jgi:hypothetical protein
MIMFTPTSKKCLKVSMTDIAKFSQVHLFTFPRNVSIFLIFNALFVRFILPVTPSVFLVGHLFQFVKGINLHDALSS